ncbi:hypothetical protein [Pararhizobium sp. DWP3-4]|uniref:hypothetical protein n=1 Tax=Pararhizobium sp. DWP3-4 TaxID=2804565 RepID=UPI003CE7734F
MRILPSRLQLPSARLFLHGQWQAGGYQAVQTPSHRRLSGNIAKRKMGKITEISCRWTSLWRSFNLAVAAMTANARMKPKEM